MGLHIYFLSLLLYGFIVQMFIYLMLLSILASLYYLFYFYFDPFSESIFSNFYLDNDVSRSFLFIPQLVSFYVPITIMLKFH